MKKRTIIYLAILITIIAVDSLVVTNIVMAPTTRSASAKEFFSIVEDTKAVAADRVASMASPSKELTVYGNVVKVLSRDLVPPRHERFVITVNNTRNLTVIYNVDYQNRGWLNAKIGDWVVFTGELINAENIHKIAEGGGFLILFRNSTKTMIEVGFYGPNDTYTVVGLLLFDIILIVVPTKIVKKKEI
ncbi:MAG: DUF3465 domain-containing protein [Candidatus Njordarchaeia archaeon]